MIKTASDIEEPPYENKEERDLKGEIKSFIPIKYNNNNPFTKWKGIKTGHQVKITKEVFDTFKKLFPKEYISHILEIELRRRISNEVEKQHNTEVYLARIEKEAERNRNLIPFEAQN